MMRRRPVLISAVAASPAVSGVACPFTLIENCCNSTRAGNTKPRFSSCTASRETPRIGLGHLPDRLNRDDVMQL